jgi:hypothetical protein
MSWTWTDVLLSWLLACGTKPAKEGALAQAFPELRQRDEKLGELARRGLVARRSDRLTLTPEGRQAALDALGLKTRPRHFTRSHFMDVLLPARALEMELSGLNLDGLRAALVSRAAGGARSSSLTRARDALLWKELGVVTDRRFTLKAVSLELLGRRLGRPVTDVGRALHLVASSEVGVAGELRAALRTRYLASLPGEAAKASLAEEGIPAFARRVLAAAAACPARFSPDRVFISALFRKLNDDSLSYPGFQQRLLDASQAGALRLARADLVEAMPLDLVRASETRGPADSTFHFVVLEGD